LFTEIKYKYYDNINKKINKTTDKHKKTKYLKDIYLDIDNISSDTYNTLNDRNRGDIGSASNRIIKCEKCNEGKEGKKGKCENCDDTFCQELKNSFKLFTEDTEFKNPEKLILVIGHCPQHQVSLSKDYYNKTYDENVTSDHVSQTFGNTTYSGLPDFNNKGKIFGITMECDDNPVYRVDIGTSRSFDQYDKSSIKTVLDENKYLYSKTPQILHIKKDGKINIIKSKMKNTRIHLPRNEYEQHINHKNKVYNELIELYHTIDNDSIINKINNRNNGIDIKIKQIEDRIKIIDDDIKNNINPLNAKKNELTDSLGNKRVTNPEYIKIVNKTSYLQNYYESNISYLTRKIEDMKKDKIDIDLHNIDTKDKLTKSLTEDELKKIIRDKLKKIIKNKMNEYEPYTKLRIDTVNTNYQQKYLKYKNKYLQLKQT
jgi:hypothetical protein